ncbi:type II secretion system protein GspG [Candidatus Microgenomates bacterium]|nr:type II secretion system protein GspG [Candidatus Microgenomates bacterium]
MKIAPQTKRVGNQRGFTIIELLVVITVVAVLIALTLPNLLSAQRRARDDVRKNNLKVIQIALESYYADAGSYPITEQGLQLLRPAYLNPLPQDPQSGDYDYQSDSQNYTVSADLENSHDPAVNALGRYMITNSHP